MLSDDAGSPSPEKENIGLRRAESSLKRQTSVTSLFLSKSSANLGGLGGKTLKLEEAQFKLRSRMAEVAPK